jgi:hypothetical protein
MFIVVTIVANLVFDLGPSLLSVNVTLGMIAVLVLLPMLILVFVDLLSGTYILKPTSPCLDCQGSRTFWGRFYDEDQGHKSHEQQLGCLDCGLLSW